MRDYISSRYRNTWIKATWGHFGLSHADERKLETIFVYCGHRGGDEKAAVGVRGEEETVGSVEWTSVP